MPSDDPQHGLGGRSLVATTESRRGSPSRTRSGTIMNTNLQHYHVPVNAVFHGPGKLVRDLPITPDKLL